MDYKKILKYILKIENSEKISNYFLILAILIFVYTLYSNYSNQNLYYISFFFLLLTGIFSEKTINGFFNSIVHSSIIISGLFILYAWITETTFAGYTFNDDKILVIIGLLYAVSSYLLINSNKELFERSRMPDLGIEFQRGGTKGIQLHLENTNNIIIAREPNVKLIIYPPNELINFKQFISFLFNLKFNKKKITISLNYKDLYPSINTKKCKQSIIIEKKLLDKLDLPRDFEGIIHVQIKMIYVLSTDQVDDDRPMITYMIKKFRFDKKKNKLHLLS